MGISCDSLKQEAEALAERMRDLYRIIHQNPELGRHELETSVLVERRLQALGIQTARVADTGIVGLLTGGRPGKTVAIRSELDALPAFWSYLPERAMLVSERANEQLQAGQRVCVRVAAVRPLVGEVDFAPEPLRPLR